MEPPGGPGRVGLETWVADLVAERVRPRRRLERRRDLAEETATERHAPVRQPEPPPLGRAFEQRDGALPLGDALVELAAPEPAPGQDVVRLAQQRDVARLRRLGQGALRLGDRGLVLAEVAVRVRQPEPVGARHRRIPQPFDGIAEPGEEGQGVGGATQEVERVRLAQGQIEPGAIALARGEAPPVEWDQELTARLRKLPEVRAAIDRMWPALNGAELVHDLFSFPGLVRSAAGRSLSAAEQQGLVRTRSATVGYVAWTEADLALIDEADALLGPRSAARTRARRRGGRDVALADAERVVAELNLGGFMTGAGLVVDGGLTAQ